MPRTPGPEAESRSLQAGWIELPAEGRSGDAPVLSWLTGAGLSPTVQSRARRLWAVWWGSPMALMWSTWDAPQLERLLMLTARSWGGETPSGLSEIRQLEDRFGLSPSARRRLHWRIVGVDLPSSSAGDLPGTGQPAAVLPSAGGKADPRLRVVGGKAAG